MMPDVSTPTVAGYSASGSSRFKSRKNRRHRDSIFRGWVGNLVMLAGGVIMLAPFWWVIVTAFSSAASTFQSTPNWLPVDVTIDNFVKVFQEVPFAGFFLNSIVVAGLATLGALTTSVLAGYAFARFRFRGSRVLFVAFLASMMIPQQVTVVPTFILMKNLGLVDHLAALWLPGMINAFGIFFMRQFFLGMGRDTEEAARIDGCGYLRTLVSVVVPQMKAPLGALAIFVYQLWWNDFFWSRVFLYSFDKATLPLGLVRLQGLHGDSPAAVLFAAITLILIPILAIFVFTQRFLTESLAATSGVAK